MPAPDVTELYVRALGKDRVIARGDDRLENYGRDESPLGFFPPDCAVLCASREEVETVLRLAREHRVPVTPRGAGSGMTGGALPLRGGVVLSVEKMTKILEIDDRDLVAVVEPGVITGEFARAAEERGLFYPPDPASLDFCSIGGNVASNAGGPRAFKYGVTREYILGLEVVLMGGECLRVGRRTSKGVTGYDLCAGFVGSEGTFGVNTEITVKLLPKPADQRTILAMFPDMAKAATAIDSLLRAGFRPRVLEIADKLSIEHVQKRVKHIPFRGAAAIALIELDGEPEGLEAITLRVGEHAERAGASEILVAQTPSERAALWAARRAISPSLREGHCHKINEDVCVPRGALVPMLAALDELAARFDFPIATFGHAGDGNLHVNILVDSEYEVGDTRARVDAAVKALFEKTIAFHGTLSGEHGIGLAKRDYLSLEQSERVIEWQRRLKRLWDPDELLNPGKILPERARSCHE